MLPSGFWLPTPNNPLQILDLPTTLQVPSLLLCSLICGPRTAVIAAIAYITIGLFFLPVFQNGGSINYLNDPSFGYLIGFIPAAWLSGKLAKQKGMNNFMLLTLSATAGLLLLQFFGVFNILIGYIFGKWDSPLPEMLFSYSIAPIPGQLTLCPAIAIVAFTIRKILIIR